MSSTGKTFLVSTGVIVVILLVGFFDPVGHVLYPKCPFLWLTGLHCPGCGTLRAIHHALHGDLGVAFSHNPLAAAAMPVVTVELLRDGWSYLRHGHVQHRHWPPKAIWALAVVVVAFWILRNIPVAPFDLLAPPA